MEFTFTFVRLFFYSLTLAAPLLFFLLVIVVLIGQVVGNKESWTWFDSFYWSLITATTVGYGDIRPLHKISKFLSIIIALIGLMLTGLIVTLTIQSAAVAFKQDHDLALIKQQIEQIKIPVMEGNNEE